MNFIVQRSSWNRGRHGYDVVYLTDFRADFCAVDICGQLAIQMGVPARELRMLQHLSELPMHLWSTLGFLMQQSVEERLEDLNDDLDLDDADREWEISNLLKYHGHTIEFCGI